MNILLFYFIHCKNKWVQVTHAWLPELQLSFDVCNSGNHAWVISTHLFLQCIGFLSSVDSSTELHLRSMLSSQVYNASESCSELLLAYGTLGRFDHIEANVIQTLVNFLTKYTTSSDYDKVVLLIHALGNTGSDKIVPGPIVVPFIFNPNIDVQFAAIDALRAVSRNEVVLEAFASYIHEAELEEQVVAVVRSLQFPFKRSLYFQQLPYYGADTSEIEDFSWISWLIRVSELKVQT